MPQPTPQISRMALLIAAPSAASSCSGGRLNSCTTVTVQAVAHSITVGSAIYALSRLCDAPTACSTVVQALGEQSQRAPNQLPRDRTIDAGKQAEDCQALGQLDEIKVLHHSTASSVRSTGVTIMVSPVSLSVMRNGLRV